MEIKCPYCGLQNWLENQNRCFQCGTVLRRCADCTSYDTRRDTCRALGVDIEHEEAYSPGMLSSSANCRRYEPLPHRLAA
jgi:hypothetical protein